MAVVPQTGAKRLRELLKQEGKIVLAPGVFDGFTARLALATGFDALYMVSFRPNSYDLFLTDPYRPVRVLQYQEWAGQISA